MAYKLNKKGIEMRKNLNDRTIYSEYVVQYESEIRRRGGDCKDYCIPFTKQELNLLRKGHGTFVGPDEYGNYVIDDGLTIGIED